MILAQIVVDNFLRNSNSKTLKISDTNVLRIIAQRICKKESWHMSYAEIAQQASCHVRTVYRCVARLKEQKIINVGTYKSTYANSVNDYSLSKELYDLYAVDQAQAVDNANQNTDVNSGLDNKLSGVQCHPARGTLTNCQGLYNKSCKSNNYNLESDICADAQAHSVFDFDDNLLNGYYEHYDHFDANDLVDKISEREIDLSHQCDDIDMLNKYDTISEKVIIADPIIDMPYKPQKRIKNKKESVLRTKNAMAGKTNYRSVSKIDPEFKFIPEKFTPKLLHVEHSKKYNYLLDDELRKFKNKMQSLARRSANWDAEFMMWLEHIPAYQRRFSKVSSKPSLPAIRNFVESKRDEGVNISDEQRRKNCAQLSEIMRTALSKKTSIHSQYDNAHERKALDIMRSRINR